MDEEAGAEVQDLLKATRPEPNSDLPGAGGWLCTPDSSELSLRLHSWSWLRHFRLLTLPLLLFHVERASSALLHLVGQRFNNHAETATLEPSRLPAATCLVLPVRTSPHGKLRHLKGLEADSELQCDISLVLSIKPLTPVTVQNIH